MYFNEKSIRSFKINCTLGRYQLLFLTLFGAGQNAFDSYLAEKPENARTLNMHFVGL